MFSSEFVSNHLGTLSKSEEDRLSESKAEKLYHLRSGYFKLNSMTRRAHHIGSSIHILYLHENSNANDNSLGRFGRDRQQYIMTRGPTEKIGCDDRDWPGLRKDTLRTDRGPSTDLGRSRSVLVSCRSSRSARHLAWTVPTLLSMDTIYKNY